VKIYALRHGYAGDYIGKDQGEYFVHNPEDLVRPLKRDGIAAAKAVAQWMADNDEIPNQILCSPVTRATQTGKIIASELGIRCTVEENLEISKPWEMVVKRLAADDTQKRIALVAHKDNILPGMRALNFLSGADKFDVDPIAMAELRIIRVDRKSFLWDELDRVLPSDLGETDYY
jgi:phosphohistidine phosphatase SixA